MYGLPETTNLRSNDRVLELAPMEGKTALTNQGQPDKRLFTGEQKLHVKMDPATTLWYFQWETNGVLPGGLKGTFTGFKSAIKHAESYFSQRNIKITQVND
jgi:hypothetical protein